MNTKGAMLAVLVVCLLATPVFAQEGGGTNGNSPAASSKPAIGLDRARYLVGTWKCSGEAFGSIMTIKPELGGVWLAYRVDQQKTAKNPSPMTDVGVIGYDPVKKKYTSVGYDNLGGYDTETSDDGSVYTGTEWLNGTETELRDTYSTKGDNESHHVEEVQVAGEWKKVLEQTCKRQ
jgi:hypothetical protein